jgi:hypothetical protein
MPMLKLKICGKHSVMFLVIQVIIFISFYNVKSFSDIDDMMDTWTLQKGYPVVTLTYNSTAGVVVASQVNIA